MARPPKPRARGTGSITEHKHSGRYLWRYQGKSGYAETYREADLILQLMIERAEQRGPLTVTEWLEQWLDRRELEGRVRHVAMERRHVGAYVASYEPFTTRPLAKLSRRDCVKWLRWLEQRPSSRGGRLAKSTITQARALLSRALSDAADDALLPTNPLRDVRILGGAEKRPHEWLRPEEVEAVLALKLDPKQRSIITVAIFTGLSPLELWSLRWEHVRLDGDAPLIEVRGTVKRSSRVRDVPLVRLLPDYPGPVDALLAWREEQTRLRRLAVAKGKAPVISPLVWPSVTGSVLAPTADPARWRAKSLRKDGKIYERKSIPEQAGIKRHIVFRDLRHTFASNLVSGSWGAPIDLHRLARLMGHSDVQATQIYAHLHPDAAMGALRAIDLDATRQKRGDGV